MSSVWVWNKVNKWIKFVDVRRATVDIRKKHSSFPSQLEAESALRLSCHWTSTGWHLKFSFPSDDRSGVIVEKVSFLLAKFDFEFSTSGRNEYKINDDSRLSRQRHQPKIKMYLVSRLWVCLRAVFRIVKNQIRILLCLQRVSLGFNDLYEDFILFWNFSKSWRKTVKSNFETKVFMKNYRPHHNWSSKCSTDSIIRASQFTNEISQTLTTLAQMICRKRLSDHHQRTIPFQFSTCSLPRIKVGNWSRKNPPAKERKKMLSIIKHTTRSVDMCFD